MIMNVVTSGKATPIGARDLTILVSCVTKKKRILKSETWSNLERDQIFNQHSGGFLCKVLQKLLNLE